MAREVNVQFSGWRATGANVQVPQYEVNVTYNWVTNAGETRTRTRLVRFPNFFQQIPAEIVQEELQDMMIRAVRRIEGVDD